MLLGAIVSVWLSPDHQVRISFGWLLAGWFFGAALAEGTPTGFGGALVPRPAPTWLRRVPIGIAAQAIVSTALALTFRRAATSGPDLIGWGLAALARAAIVAVTTRLIVTAPTSTVSIATASGDGDDPDRELRANAIGAITGGGAALALLCLLHQPAYIAGDLPRVGEVDGLNGIGLVWTIGAILLGLALAYEGRRLGVSSGSS